MWLSFFLSHGICWTITELSPLSWQSPSTRGTFLDHTWSKSAVWQSPPTRGTFLDHIWSKSAVWQSPPMRGTFQTTFGQSLLRDKVLQWGAHFGPHLVEVRCVTKSSSEGHFFDHIWSKSAAWQKPPTRGIFSTCMIGVRCVTRPPFKGPWIFCHTWQFFYFVTILFPTRNYCLSTSQRLTLLPLSFCSQFKNPSMNNPPETTYWLVVAWSKQ